MQSYNISYVGLELTVVLEEIINHEVTSFYYVNQYVIVRIKYIFKLLITIYSIIFYRLMMMECYAVIVSTKLYVD